MQLDTKNVYLLLGSNLGDRKKLIDDAIMKIQLRVGKIFAKSSFYETAAWGNTDQPAFLNIAVGVETGLSALQLLDEVLAIELELGRIRHERWGARLIDIDIIFYGDAVITVADKLQIPHPEMQNRKFVLKPLAEIAGNMRHPILKNTILELLDILNDNLHVSKI